MSDDISEVGRFEPREYMGMFLTEQLPHRPHVHAEQFVRKLGTYDVYSTPVDDRYFLIDGDGGHFYLARKEHDFLEKENPPSSHT